MEPRLRADAPTRPAVADRGEGRLRPNGVVLHDWFLLVGVRRTLLIDYGCCIAVALSVLRIASWSAWHRGRTHRVCVCSPAPTNRLLVPRPLTPMSGQLARGPMKRKRTAPCEAPTKWGKGTLLKEKVLHHLCWGALQGAPREIWLNPYGRRKKQCNRP